MGVQSWLGTISALTALPCLCSKDGCRNHLVHYSFIYLFIYFYLNVLVLLKQALAAGPQPDGTELLSKKNMNKGIAFWCCNFFIGLFISSALFSLLAPPPPLEFGVQMSKKLSNFCCCCWFCLHLVLIPKDLGQTAPEREIHRLSSESSGRLHHGVLVQWGRREICPLSGSVLTASQPFRFRCICSSASALRPWAGSINSFQPSKLMKSHQVVTLCHYDVG